jgi:hypothetical protein
MNLHFSFGIVNYKLWPKEKLEIKLSIWLSNPKKPNKQKLNDLQRKHATWNRKYIIESYNFVVKNSSIGINMKKIKVLQSCNIHNLRLLKINHFNTIFTKRFKTYCREENDGLFSNLNHMNIMNPKQIQSCPKLISFALITYIV